MNGSTDVRGVVVTPEHIHFPGGGVHPAGVLAFNLPQLLAGGRLAQHTAIVCDGATVADHARHANEVRAAGWGFSSVGPWTTYHRDGRTVSIGLRANMETHHFGALVTRDTDPGVLAMLLHQYGEAIGGAWRGTCATSALAALRLSWENVPGKPLWKLPDRGPGLPNSVAMAWERPLNDWESTWGWVHTFDLNKAYLAAMINAEVARSELVHVGPQLFDANLPGYWLVQLDPATLALLDAPGRPPLVARMLKGGCAWVTTPIGRLLGELGDRGEVLDSWTGRAMPAGEVRGRRVAEHPANVRAFRKLGERLRDELGRARNYAVAGALQASYQELAGALQRESMRVFRPDWAHTIIDLAKANLYRRMMRIHTTEGIWPVRVVTDSVSYADCAETIEHWRSVLPLSPQLGHFKHERTWTTQEWADRKRAE